MSGLSEGVRVRPINGRHQEYEGQEKSEQEPSDVCEIVDVGKDPDDEIQHPDEEERCQCFELFGIQSPVRKKLRNYSSYQTKQCTRRADRDAVLDEQS